MRGLLVAAGLSAAAAAADESPCHTALPGSTCYAAVRYARSEGIYAHPLWYPGVNETSSFEDFQEILHNSGKSECPEPCPAMDNPGFRCESDMNDRNIVQPSKKGMNLDDTTFHWCHDNIPSYWPNTGEAIGALRLFHAWEADWAEPGRLAARADVIRYIKRHDVKVFVGAPVSCNRADDDVDWARTKEYMRMVGPEHIMGVSIGNEMDLLWTKDYVKAVPGCIQELWEGGRYWQQTQDFIADLDAMGEDFARIPVTAVWTGAAVTYGGDPFVESPVAMVRSYVRNASQTYGRRWVWSLNFYTYWDPSARTDPGSSSTCDEALHTHICWGASECGITESFRHARSQIKLVTGNDDDMFWIPEVGWSAPATTALPSEAARNCPDWISNRTFAKFYDNFLQYDMQLDGVRGPDYIFFFSMRDASQFGTEEHFGLLDSGTDPTKLCESTRCKLHARDFEVPSVAAEQVVELIV